MTTSTRHNVRDRLVTIFTADGSFNAVYGYLPTSLQGFNKVLAIYTRRSRHIMTSADMTTNLYTLSLDVMVKRGTGTEEDTLDNLHETVRSVIRANTSDATWDNIQLEEQSDAFFAEISGVAYRVERHPLVVKVIT